MTSRERSRVAGTSESTERSLKISSWYLTEVTVLETRLQAQDAHMWHLTWTGLLCASSRLKITSLNPK